MGTAGTDRAADTRGEQPADLAAIAGQLDLVQTAGDQAVAGGADRSHRRRTDRDRGLVAGGLNHAADLDALLAAQADAGAAAAGAEVALKADAVIRVDRHPAAVAGGDQVAGRLDHQAGGPQAKGGAGIAPARQAGDVQHQLIDGLEVTRQPQQLSGRQAQVTANAAGLHQTGDALPIARAQGDGAGGIGANQLTAGGHIQIKLTGAAAGVLGPHREPQLIRRLQGSSNDSRLTGVDRQIASAAAGIDQAALIEALAVARVERDRAARIGCDQPADGRADRLHLQAQAGEAGAAVGGRHADLELVAGLKRAEHLHPPLGADRQITGTGAATAAGGDRARQQLAVTGGEGDGAGAGGGGDGARGGEGEVALIHHGAWGVAAHADDQLVGGRETAAHVHTLTAGDEEITANAGGRHRAGQGLAIKAGEADGTGGGGGPDLAAADLLQTQLGIGGIGFCRRHTELKLVAGLQPSTQIDQTTGANGEITAIAAGADLTAQLLAVAAADGDRTGASAGPAGVAKAIQIIGSAEQHPSGLRGVVDGDRDRAAGGELAIEVGLLVDQQGEIRCHQTGQVHGSPADGMVVGVEDQQQAGLQLQRGLGRFDHPGDRELVAQQGGAVPQAGVHAVLEAQIADGELIAAVAAAEADLAEAIGQGRHVLAR